MEFIYTTWTIDDLASYYYADKLDLSPLYQRNEVWSKKAKRELIDTITSHRPVPNFFVYKNGNDSYEMVDGQQRSRSILSFLKGGSKPLTNSKNETIDDHPNFKKYPLNITLITEIGEKEHIEEFYALVNRTGLRLNNPELFKAQFYDTNFLALIEEITDDDDFKKLGIFRSVNRMNDSDLVSELLTLLKFGITDKKEKVERLFTGDVSKEEASDLKEHFFKIISVLNLWNRVYPLNKTRYKQKNDLYTLFSLINEFSGRDKILLNIYKWLHFIEDEISPSQTECEPFKNYAIHCVTQSNSKNAREQRLKLIKEIVFPEENLASTKEIMKFYELEDSDHIKIDGVTMYNPALFLGE